MIEFKFAMRTDDGTRMFRAIVDGRSVPGSAA